MGWGRVAKELAVIYRVGIAKNQAAEAESDVQPTRTRSADLSTRLKTLPHLRDTQFTTRAQVLVDDTLSHRAVGRVGDKTTKRIQKPNQLSKKKEKCPMKPKPSKG